MCSAGAGHTPTATSLTVCCATSSKDGRNLSSTGSVIRSRKTSKLFRIRGNLELILARLVERTPQALLEPSEQPEADLSVEGLRRREYRTSAIRRDPRVQVVVDYLVAHPRNPLTRSFRPAWRT